MSKNNMPEPQATATFIGHSTVNVEAHVPAPIGAVLEQYAIVIEWLLHSPQTQSLVDIVRDNYISGYDEFKGPHMDATYHMCYPGDPPQAPLARLVRLNDELNEIDHMWFYRSDFAAIWLPDEQRYVWTRLS